MALGRVGAGLRGRHASRDAVCVGVRRCASVCASCRPRDALAPQSAIVGFEIVVDAIDAKFKLSQNRPDDTAAIAAALDAEQQSALAALVREHAPRTLAKL